MNGPIFVVGTPRSGTTLTAEILGRNSAVFMSDENHFFEDIYARREEFGDPCNPVVRDELIRRLRTIYGRYNQSEFQAFVDGLWSDEVIGRNLRAVATTYPRLLDGFYRAQMPPGKHVWGNQTPKDIFHVNEIRACFPSARFVVCIRDVRDFLYSYKNRWRVTTVGHADRLRVLYHPVTTSLLWRATMRQLNWMKLSVAADAMTVVKYEDLVRHPERVIRELCETVGLAFEADMLRVSSHNSSKGAGGSGIFSSSVGAWRQGLKSEEVSVAETLTGADLQAFGYDLENPACNAVTKAAIWASFPWAIARALAANRDNRGPLIPYLAKRGLSLLKSA